MLDRSWISIVVRHCVHRDKESGKIGGVRDKPLNEECSRLQHYNGGRADYVHCGVDAGPNEQIPLAD